MKKLTTMLMMLQLFIGVSTNAQDIVITEIMYNPPESGTDSLEFIEFYNNGTATVNLDGFQISQGVVYTFPNIDLLPDSYILVSVDSVSMMSTFGASARQWTSGALSNGGEDIELQDSFGNIVDYVDYDDMTPWPSEPDGNGPSLTLCNPSSDNSLPANWTSSDVFAAINANGDSIWATPGFECQVELLPGFEADETQILVGDSVFFTDLTVGNPIEWIWTFEGGTPDTFTGQTPPAIVYDVEGTWDVTLNVSDGVNTEEITYEDYIEVVYLAVPTNLQAVVGPYDDVQLTWNAPVLNVPPQTKRNVNADILGYNVYRDDIQINTSIVEVTEYNDPEPTIGSHDYYVTAVYDGGESDPSNVVSVVITDINEVATNAISIYPNPTDGILTIEFSLETTIDVSLMDITGNEVHTSTLNSTSQIDIGNLQKGMYIVRLIDRKSNNIFNKKIIVR